MELLVPHLQQQGGALARMVQWEQQPARCSQEHQSALRRGGMGPESLSTAGLHLSHVVFVGICTWECCWHSIRAHHFPEAGSCSQQTELYVDPSCAS